MNQTNLKRFSDTYLVLLTEDITKNRNSYYMAPKKDVLVPEYAGIIHGRMMRAITENGIYSVSIEGNIKKVAKKLGLNPTLKAIAEFLNESA